MAALHTCCMTSLSRSSRVSGLGIRNTRLIALFRNDRAPASTNPTPNIVTSRWVINESWLKQDRSGGMTSPLLPAERMITTLGVCLRGSNANSCDRDMKSTLSQMYDRAWPTRRLPRAGVAAIIRSMTSSFLSCSEVPTSERLLTSPASIKLSRNSPVTSERELSTFTSLPYKETDTRTVAALTSKAFTTRLTKFWKKIKILIPLNTGFVITITLYRRSVLESTSSDESMRNATSSADVLHPAITEVLLETAICRVTIRPAQIVESPAFTFSQPEQLELGYANVSRDKLRLYDSESYLNDDFGRKWHKTCI